MRLREAQLMIRKSGRFVRVLVKDEADDSINEELLSKFLHQKVTLIIFGSQINHFFFLTIDDELK